MEFSANASSFVEMLGGQVLAQIGVGVILTDAEGCIQWANSRQQWFTGIASTLLLGASAADHAWFGKTGVHEAVRIALEKGATQHLFLQQNNACRIEVMPLFLQRRCLGAAVLFYPSQAYPVDSRSQAAAAAARPELSEHQEQRVLLQLFRTMLDHLPFAVAVLDEEQTALYANRLAQDRAGHKKMGFSWRDLIPQSLHAEVAARLDECREQVEPCLVHGRLTESEPSCISISFMQTEDGLPLHVMAIWEAACGDAPCDASAFSAQIANICYFAARVVHDIRNPICALMGEMELLRNENLYEEGGVHRFHTALDLFSQEVNILKTIMEEIEPLGSLEPAHLTLTELEAVLINACSVAEMNRPYEGSHVIADIPHGYPEIYCDSLRLQKVMSGLLEYAMKEAGVAGSVQLSLRYTEEDGFTIRLQFMNSGKGLLEPLPNEPLWRSATFRLALASAIVLELGGQFEVKRYQGQGTEIRMVFPPQGDEPAARMRGSKRSNQVVQHRRN